MLLIRLVVLFISVTLLIEFISCDNVPIVINTWRFEQANSKAWAFLEKQHSALDAIVAGCSACEIEQCDGTVGFGGSPDENGETILDAMIMDGKTMNVGSVVSLRHVKNAIGVARVVLEHTEHSILSGMRATQFAFQMGFPEESLSTDASKSVWKKWKEAKCQPNFWKDVYPDPKTKCGPYKLNPIITPAVSSRQEYLVGPNNHDTIGMIALDKDGNLVAGTSTNGATHKIPGRVADSGIPGSGCYADQTVGAAAATGDGDIMMRFSPSFLAVEEMRRGSSPTQAAEVAVLRIAEKYPTYSGAVIAMDRKGNYGAACYGISEFPFCVSNPGTDGVLVETVPCKTLNKSEDFNDDETNDI